MPRFTRDAIARFQWDVARGASRSSVARKHGFAVSNFRRWDDKFGWPVVHYEPTDADLVAAKAWRREKTLAKAWRVMRDFARAGPWEKDAELPDVHLNVGDEQYERVMLRTRADARTLLVCEKLDALNALDEWRDRKPSVAHRTSAALATIPWLSSRWACRTIRDHAKSVGAHVAFFGDLDPQAIHAFAVLRAGGREAVLERGETVVDARWIGIDSRWLDWLEKASGVHNFTSCTISMRWLDREYWDFVKRAVPDVRSLIGARAHAMLDSGTKLEVDSIMHFREPFLAECDRRLSKLSGRRMRSGR